MANAIRTCSKPDCEKPHRAKGLCSTHYGQAMPKDKRHAQATVPCGWCDKACVKPKDQLKKYTAAFCTLACRDGWRAWQAGTSVVQIPLNHPANQHWRHRGWRLPATRPPKRLRGRPGVANPRPRLWVGGTCSFCGVTYLAEDYTGSSRYCSRQCARRIGRIRRRAREVGSYGEYTWMDVVRLAARFEWRCAYCETETTELEPDHVVPLSRGGPNTVANLLPSCRMCNCDKRDLLLDEWAVDRARRGLPARTTRWLVGDPRTVHLTSIHSAA